MPRFSKLPKKHSRFVLNCIRKASLRDRSNTQASSPKWQNNYQKKVKVKSFCSPEDIVNAIILLHYQCFLTATRLQYFLRDKVLTSMAGFLPSNRTGNTEGNRNKFLIKSPKFQFALFNPGLHSSIKFIMTLSCCTSMKIGRKGFHTPGAVKPGHLGPPNMLRQQRMSQF